MRGTTEQSDEYVFACDVTVNNAGDNDLYSLSVQLDELIGSRRLTVGIAMPHATFFIVGPADPRAGDFTSAPAKRYTTKAVTTYMVMSVTCNRAKAFGQSLASFISLMKPKNATWPATGN